MAIFPNSWLNEQMIFKTCVQFRSSGFCGKRINRCAGYGMELRFRYVFVRLITEKVKELKLMYTADIKNYKLCLSLSY